MHGWKPAHEGFRNESMERSKRNIEKEDGCSHELFPVQAGGVQAWMV